MNPKISINLCCYNSEKFLRATMQSIVSQTYKNWEVVVINDGSTDATESIIREFENLGYPINYQYQQNNGLSYSRNKAVDLSLGKYIAFIDHDDLWLPDKLEKQVNIINEEEEDIGIVYSKALWFNDSGEEGELPYKYIGFDCPEGRIFEELLINDNFIPLSTALVLKDAYISVGGVPTRYIQSEDYYLFVAVSYSYKVRCVQNICCKYRIHKDNNTARQLTKGYEEILEIYEQWLPLMNEKILEKQKDYKIRKIQTLIGGSMIKNDQKYWLGLKRIISSGSFPFFCKRVFIDRFL